MEALEIVKGANTVFPVTKSDLNIITRVSSRDILYNETHENMIKTHNHKNPSNTL